MEATQRYYACGGRPHSIEGPQSSGKQVVVLLGPSRWANHKDRELLQSDSVKNDFSPLSSRVTNLLFQLLAESHFGSKEASVVDLRMSRTLGDFHAHRQCSLFHEDGVVMQTREEKSPKAGDPIASRATGS
ncbi:unnamed protein product [Strongylus vulgaris]|uniref:Uncharacterized protein n=1 Tax=Strongylus vulgaris TaxID=40348 RepID=A0A3P7K5J8_STRVU|nr:unnamed protein product [Strongylus vulgaris]